MSESGDTQRKVAALAMSGPLCIYNAVENKGRLLEALYASDVLELDLSRVDELDSAGFQLLVLAKRESVRLGKHLKLVAHSTPVREVIDFYNMDSFFGDPVVIPANSAT